MIQITTTVKNYLLNAGFLAFWATSLPTSLAISGFVSFFLGQLFGNG
jgi:hypothetical protein